MQLWGCEELNQNILKLPGVGKVRGSQLEKLGIKTILDLISYYPKEYEDRTKIYSIKDLPHDQTGCIIATITSAPLEIRIKKNLTIIKVKATDHSGKITLSWFNQTFIKTSIYIGKTYIFFGKVEWNGKEMQIQNPDWEEYNDKHLKEFARIVPIYPLTKGVSQNMLRKLISKAMQKIDKQIENFIPEEIRKKYDLTQVTFNLNQVHFPDNFEALQTARHSLAFEELYRVALAMQFVKKNSQTAKGISYRFFEDKMQTLESRLPFSFTNAQKKVLEEIYKDMASEKVMNRLVQGDVGSGKTVVALMAIYNCICNGYQAALIAPTEILATQHYHGMVSILEGLDVQLTLLTGSLSKKQKLDRLQGTKEGRYSLIIGTHALLEEQVEFYNLGLVVTDEQHRFGVRQRIVFGKKGNHPDVLVMSATPIPRTLALILYGDLDISIIDELPPGRELVETYSVSEQYRERMYAFIKKNLHEGGQVYIVCPAIEESETIKLKNVEEVYKELSGREFKNYKLEMIHGKLRPSEKEKAMQRFADGETQVLLATTVIEVGVNVPNANVMIVENAERFGLSQLHQLRGRVGRGRRKSYCILMNQSKGEVALNRMKALCQSNDGFFISEQDLKLRGPGDFFGVRQHGIPEFKIANLYEDMAILNQAQEAAELTIINGFMDTQKIQCLSEFVNAYFVL